MRQRNRLAGQLFAAALILASGLALAGCTASRPPRPTTLGLFTSLPILFPETSDIRGLLSSEAPPHWALAVLAERGALRPLNVLEAARLKDIGLLVIAQPRPLAPLENITLDQWLRGGGRVLLFADPLLTAESAFGFGDKRRAQDMVLLSPILTRWGLELAFDEAQPEDAQIVTLFGGAFPVHLPGRLAAMRKENGCKIADSAVAASCRIGKGRLLVIADAALLEEVEAGLIPDRQALLKRLISAADSENPVKP